MKKFFVNYEIRDGEHEHCSYMIFEFESYEAAVKGTAIKKESCGILDHEDEPMSFGDCLTCTTITSIEEVSDEEYEVLRKFLRGV